jgi:hypothetical protein
MSASGREEPITFKSLTAAKHIAAFENSILNDSFPVSCRSKFLD